MPQWWVMCEHVGNLMSLMKFLLRRKSWNGNLWVLLNLQLSSTPASPSNPTLWETCALSVLLLSCRTGVQQPHHTMLADSVWKGTLLANSVGLLLGATFPGLGGAQYEAKPSRVCVAPSWGKMIRWSSCFGWVAYKISRVYWVLGCFCVCFNLQLADMGKIDC